MEKKIQYRFSFKTDSVYSFCMFPYAGTLAGYKNEVSGFISKSKFKEFWKALWAERAKGKYFENFKLVESKRYWKNYDQYQAETEYKMKFTS